MIVKPKEIYQKVSEKNNIPIDIIESIGNIVFQSLRSHLNTPTDIAYELPELGTFIHRFHRFEYLFELTLKRLEENDEATLEIVNSNLERHQRNLNLYNKMQEYRKDKKEIKKIRNEQNNSIKSSEDNFEEH